MSNFQFRSGPWPPLFAFVQVYVASKYQYAPLWRSLRAAGLNIRSSWIDDLTETRLANDLPFLDSPCRLSEAAEADAVILYHEDTETDTLALMEAGAALAAGKQVFAVGPRNASLGREGHPNWTHCFTLPEALRSMRLAG